MSNMNIGISRSNAILSFFYIIAFSLGQHLKIDSLVWVKMEKGFQNGIEKMKDKYSLSLA